MFSRTCCGDITTNVGGDVIRAERRPMLRKSASTRTIMIKKSASNSTVSKAVMSSLELTGVVWKASLTCAVNRRPIRHVLKQFIQINA